MRCATLLMMGLFVPASLSRGADDPTPIFPRGEKPADARLGKPKDLNGYFPLLPPTTKEGWNDRVKQVREQLWVANGLWPLPEKTAMNPVIHGKIERDGYTIEKVFFASMPGHYVCGNLYRPTTKVDGKRPAILNPHGHWPNGRFMEANANEVKNQMATKETKTGKPAEATEESARYPLQAKCVGLARMGFVVFLYDMVGYADSTAIKHREGFADTNAELRLQNFMGLQTWNSIRAFDFLSSLPDVNPKRVAVTGASGGGTQTFILCALDDRPIAAFPAVMVSTAMQGGCICENCSYLRVGTGNIEFAGMFAPKPLAMSGAKDWTIDIMTKGLPELKYLYKLYNKEDLVDARCWPEFGHNYNQVSREYMYHWFNKHVLAQDVPVAEQPFKPVPPKELSVFDDKHPRPKDELNAADLRKAMTEASDKQMATLIPKDAASLAEFRRVVGTAVRVMIGDQMPKGDDIVIRRGPDAVKVANGITMHKAVLGRKGEEDAVPAVGVFNEKFRDTVVIWVHPAGKSSLFEKGELVPAAKAMVEKGIAVVAPDVFQTGELTSEKPFPVNTGFAGYTYGYNRTVLGNRVHDILTAVGFAQSKLKAKTIHLIGWDEAGPWAVAARALAGDAVAKTAVDLNQFRFENVKSTADPMMLPGAVKYGGLPAMLALCAPGELFTHNHEGTSSGRESRAAYEAAGAKDKLVRQPAKATPMKVVEWLMGTSGGK